MVYLRNPDINKTIYTTLEANKNSQILTFKCHRVIVFAKWMPNQENICINN